MTLTTEILIFETTDVCRNDPKSLLPTFDIALKAAGGHAPVYYGVQIEDQTTAYVFLNWDSYEAHKALIDGPTYPALAESLKPALGGKTDMYHVQFSSETIALEKPVTGVLIFTLKAPENRAAVVEILSKISEASGKILVFGHTREDENKYVLISGWPSVEEHMKTAARPEVAAAFEKLFSLADKDLRCHIKLSQYHGL